MLIVLISSDIMCVVAGITSDANTLIDHARLVCQRHQLTYGEPIPVEQLVQAVCNMKQSYTQHGGMRPFGVSFLFAGWDRIYGYQLYQSDPSGNYGGWKAICIGANSSAVQSFFKTEYPEEENASFSIEEGAKMLLAKGIGKAIENTTVSADKRKEISLTLIVSRNRCHSEKRGQDHSRSILNSRDRDSYCPVSVGHEAVNKKHFYLHSVLF